MPECPVCRAPVTLVPDGDPRYVPPTDRYRGFDGLFDYLKAPPARALLGCEQNIAEILEPCGKPTVAVACERHRDDPNLRFAPHRLCEGHALMHEQDPVMGVTWLIANPDRTRAIPQHRPKVLPSAPDGGGTDA